MWLLCTFHVAYRLFISAPCLQNPPLPLLSLPPCRLSPPRPAARLRGTRMSSNKSVARDVDVFSHSGIQNAEQPWWENNLKSFYRNTSHYTVRVVWKLALLRIESVLLRRTFVIMSACSRVRHEIPCTLFVSLTLSLCHAKPSPIPFFLTLRSYSPSSLYSFHVMTGHTGHIVPAQCT